MIPKVSVLMPVFNAEKYLSEAIQSILSQSFRDFEFIVIDDGSTDSSASIIKSFHDDRIVYVKNEQNLGIVKSLNKGISLAKGEFVARMDADDISHPLRFEKQIEFFEQNPLVAMCGGFYKIIDNEGKIIGEETFETDPDLLKCELMFYCPFAHPSLMIKKNVLNELNGYKELTPVEDYELWLRINAKYKSVNIPEYLLFYRWHGSNISITKKNVQIKYLGNAIDHNLNDIGFSKKYINYHIRFLAGSWNERATHTEIKEMRMWKQDLINLNAEKNIFNKKALSNTTDKYLSLGLLAVLKSKSNSLRVKWAAFEAILRIDPIITLRHICKKF